MTRLGILVTALLLQTAISQNTRASIEGVVVLDSTGKPVAKALVELTVVEGPKVLSRTATTGEDGRFAFADLRPGEGYQIVVTGAGIWPTAYGQQRSYGPWTPITLAPGQHLTDVRIAAIAITQISGRILDSSGKAQIGASVLALRPTYVEGRRELQRVSSTVTNLRGEYHFTNLQPGRYYVRVSPRNDASEALFTNPALYDRSAPGSRASVRETEGYRTVYYPGVPIESAKVILLGDAQVLKDLDITVTKVDTSRVRGAVISGALSRRATAAQIALLPAGSSPDSNWGRFFNSRDGTFDLRAVQPGRYFLSAVVMETDRTLTGRMAVEVRSGEAHNFNLRVAPGVDIAGRIVMDDRNAPTTPDLSILSIHLGSDSLEPIDGTLSRARSKLPSSMAAASPDGTFVLHDVMPWDYRVNLSGLRGAYIKAVRQGNTDVLANGLRVEESAGQPLEIVLATDGGRLDGRVPDAQNAKVVLAPEARGRRDLYITASLSSTGRFQISNIPPGRYKLFAWQNPAEGSWTDPDFLERYENRGTPVDIQSEGSEYVEIRVIPVN